MTTSAGSGGVRARDLAVVAGALGRVPRDVTGIAVRCPFGYPAVIESAPVFTDGSPNPNLLYVACPAMVKAIDRIEAGGGVRRLRAACAENPALLDVLEEITGLYRARRTALIEKASGSARGRVDPRLDAGIGGPETPGRATCLHAYAAAFLAVLSGALAPGDAEDAGMLAQRTRSAWDMLLPPLERLWCNDARCAGWDPGERRAAVDIGTISVRLLVSDDVGGRPVSVVRRADVTRLGEGLQVGGRLGATPRERTAEVAARFIEHAKRHGAERIVVAGTSAIREARDGRDLIEALGREHGVSAVVLSGEQEAALAYAGASLDVGGDPVVLDVGGGSTELIVRSANGRVHPTSLRLGASRGTERWIRSDPPAVDEMETAREEAARLFLPLRQLYGAEAGGSSRRLVGVAGTVTTLAALDADLQEYDPELIHLRRLSIEKVRAHTARLAGLTTGERAALPCVQAGRAPVIVVGALIVLAALETLGYRELIVSERDLLDGLVMEDVTSW